jgi:hypothetical protein
MVSNYNKAINTFGYKEIGIIADLRDNYYGNLILIVRKAIFGITRSIEQRVI